MDGRKLDADVLVVSLEEEAVNMNDSIRRGTGPTSRTLFKNGPLSVTLVDLAAGGTIKEHHAAGPITVHVLSGDVKCTTPHGRQELHSGDLLALAPGIRHSVESDAGARFLITIAMLRDD